jgi:hypothetical protein
MNNFFSVSRKARKARKGFFEALRPSRALREKSNKFIHNYLKGVDE